MSGPVTEPVNKRPAICLNMIVRNEAHVIRELLDSVAPYISSWVIVDTGSDDGTQDLIKNHMAGLGIPGELYQREWRNFGHNRTEALSLAQGHGDYIWMIDADDILVGTPDFTRLEADIYLMRYRSVPPDPSVTFWSPWLFREGLRVRYEGVIYEHAAWDEPYVVARLEGDYHIEVRHLGARSRDPQTLARDRDAVLAEVERNPEDARSVLQLATTYFALGDFVNARKWYARRAQMGGSNEHVYHAVYRMAESMIKLGAPWPEVQDILLRAWEFRPTRAEPLYAIACRYRSGQRYQLGYLFATLAAEIPFPENERLSISPDIYAWRATEEQATCAYYLGKHAETLTLFRALLARPDISDNDRRRIADLRDVCALRIIDATSPYPQALVQSLLAGPGEAEVVVSLIAGPDRESTEETLNSFLHCCTDVSRVGRFLVLDAGLSAQDRAILQERYGFLQFGDYGPGDGPGAQLAQIRAQVDQRFWLHLGQGWQFFAPENFITRLTAVLEAEAQVFQVGINFTDAVKLIGTSAPEAAVRRAPDAGRYVLADAVAAGPAMFDTTRLDRAGGLKDTDADPIAELGRRAATAGLHTASLDEVLCIPAIHRMQQPAQPIQVRSPQPLLRTRQEMSTSNNGPIFIVGAARSGTTLMRVILDSHPRICCGPELKLLPAIAQQYRSFIGPFASVMEIYGNTLSDVRAQFRGLIEGLVENYRRASGKPRWAEKTPENVRFMVPLGEIFPEARFILMLRDGRDVACSLMGQKFFNPFTGRNRFPMENITNAAQYWRNEVMAGRQQAAHPSLSGRVLEVRYEALVTETAPTMRQVLAFLGEEWHEAVLSHHTKDHLYDENESGTAHVKKPVYRSSLGRWEQDMTELDKASFKAEAGALLTALGYGPADW